MKLFSNMFRPLDVFIDNIWKFHSSNMFSTFDMLITLIFWHSNRCVVVFYCGFNLHFPYCLITLDTIEWYCVYLPWILFWKLNICSNIVLNFHEAIYFLLLDKVFVYVLNGVFRCNLQRVFLVSFCSSFS